MTVATPADRPQEAAVDPAARGITRVSPHVVERIAAFACNRADLVVTPRTHAGVARSAAPRARAEVAGRIARLSVTVAAQYPSSMTALAASVRSVVSADVERLCGLTVVAVDVDAQPLNMTRKARVR